MSSSTKKLKLLPSPQKIVYRPGDTPRTETAEIKISNLAPQNGYKLQISSKEISITADSEASAYHAKATLKQICSQCPTHLPNLEIEDWPDLAVRGYMLDISRCKVPKQKTLYQLVDLLAALKYNQLQLYTEHTFAYPQHERVWRDASPLTPEDVRNLDAYCQSKYIELVPNLNTFGHMERWLRHPEYHHLAESPEGFEHPISGWKEFGSTLKPDAASADFVDQLIAQLTPSFSSKKLNIGGDEPWELGQGASKHLVQKQGKTRVYLDHLKRIQKKTHERGFEMQFWGDTLLNKPELATELSPNTTALLWGYEADHPFAKQCQAMQSAGIDFYVAPGTSTWNSIGGRLYTAGPNIEKASTQAKKSGAKGLLLTDWGDNGHHQSDKLSIIPIVIAAANAWSRVANENLIETACINLIPNPLSNSEYNAIRKLSDIAGSFSKYLHNQSWLNKVLFAKEKDYPELSKSLQLAELEKARQELLAIAVSGELDLTRQLLVYAAQKGLAISRGASPNKIPKTLVERYRDFWLKRNRPGGLPESLSYLPA